MSNCNCGKSIEVGALQAQQRRVLIIVLVINVATFAMMIAAALYGRSSSLLSGGLDNFGDAITYALSLAVIGASDRAKAKVALVKGILILGVALGVAGQIVWRLSHPGMPIFEAIGMAALLNLAANGFCLRLLTPYRYGDVNLASTWECSRNDVYEGFAVLAAGLGVWLFDAGWPDLLIAVVLLLLFLRSAWRVLRSAWHELNPVNLTSKQ